jgi:hypothetical protein
VLRRNFTDEVSGAILYESAARHVVIVFAGTKSELDWLANMMGVRTESEAFEGLAVHAGFAHQAGSQLDQVYGTLDRILDKLEGQDLKHPLRITVTGHSLGGAMSTLLAYHIKVRMSETTVENITFGCPRAFSLGSSFRVESILGLGQTLRMANERDPVTMVPHSGAFRHIGIPVPLQSHHEHCKVFGATLGGFLAGLPNGLLSATTGALQAGGKRVTEYHAMQTYVDNLHEQYPAFRELVLRRVELLRRVRVQSQVRPSKAGLKGKSKEEEFFPQAFERAQRAKKTRMLLRSELDPDWVHTKLEAELDRVFQYDERAHGGKKEEYARLLTAAIESLNE